MYVTSSGTGAIYRGDLRHRRLRLFAPGGDEGRTSAAGVRIDGVGQVYVAGRTALDVYDVRGHLVERRPAPAGPGGAPFLNDLVLTRDAIYVTDSANAVVYRAARHGARPGALGALKPWFDARTIQPNYPVYYWYLNGIVADHTGRTLLVAAQGIGALVRVDTGSATGELVDTGGINLGADGLTLTGRHTLYAILNYEPPASGTGIYRLRLGADWRTASDLHRLPDSGLDDPTSLALDARNRLLVVDSQLDHAPGRPPYTVTAVPIDPANHR